MLKHLLFWPVTGPTFLTRFSLSKVGETVRKELTDDQSIKEELLALQMKVELGEIDDEEYVREEAALMERLREVRHWREEFGMGTSGGPVRVAPAEEAPSVAEHVVAAPEGAGQDEEDREDQEDRQERPRGGIASAEGASVELDWEEEE